MTRGEDKMENLNTILPRYYFEEEWRTVEEAPKYEVSSFGRLRNAETLRLRKPQYDKDGYVRAVLVIDKDKKITRFIHRLVSEAFVANPNPEKLTIINHKDEVKTNNHVSNLEWCDQEYNLAYGTARERAHQTRLKNGAYISAKNSHIKIYEYDEEMNLLKVHNSTRACANALGLNPSTLSHYFLRNPNGKKTFKGSVLTRVKTA